MREQLKNIGLTLGALGVVYGDIGTSPLYAINEIFFGAHASESTTESVLGSISLVIWALILIIACKYLIFVLRANKDGEGGVFALYSHLDKQKGRTVYWLKILLMLAAGLLLGEGMITPAISVLSAVEGLTVLNPQFSNDIIPITIIILSILFFLQSWGSHKVGKFFGPIAFFWFLVMSILGLNQILQTPEILKSFLPTYGLQYLFQLGFYKSLLLLGSVMLVITGGEAVFADMGHFGIKPIRLGWFAFVFPSLLLNYLGQGAYLLSGQTVQNRNIFYSLVPENFLWPMIILSTFATVIASQALISGAFTLLSQSIGLGIFPRLKVIQTHHEHSGQTYVPFMNFLLYLGTVVLTIQFGSSTRLASFYGFSMLSVMFITTLTMMFIGGNVLQWSLKKSVLIFSIFAVFEISFLFSKSMYFFSGAYIPLSVGFIFFSVMRIWRWGRKATYKSYTAQSTIKVKELIELKKQSTAQLDRNVVFMVPKPIQSEEDNIPALVQFFINRYQTLPKNLFMVEVIHRKVPFIHTHRSHSLTFYKSEIQGSIVSVKIQFGFMEEPNVEKALEHLAKHHEIELPTDPHKWLIHVSHEYIVRPIKANQWKFMQFRAFVLLRQITQPAYYYYGLGKDISLSMDIMPVRID